MEISYSSWPWHRSDATALAGYANMMMMMMRLGEEKERRKKKPQSKNIMVCPIP